MDYDKVVVMQDSQKIKVLKALADPTRLEMVRSLNQSSDGKLSCSSLSNCSGLSQPAKSHHFGKLVEAGVLLDHKDGIKKYYEIDYELLRSIGIDAKKL